MILRTIVPLSLIFGFFIDVQATTSLIHQSPLTFNACSFSIMSLYFL